MRSSSCTTMYTALTASGRIRCSMLAMYCTVGLYSMAPPPFLWMASPYHQNQRLAIRKFGFGHTKLAHISAHL